MTDRIGQHKKSLQIPVIISMKMICTIFHAREVSYLRALAAQSRLDESLLAVKQVDLIHRSLAAATPGNPIITVVFVIK